MSTRTNEATAGTDEISSATGARVIAGATGIVGSRLTAELRRRGSPVRALSRNPAAAARTLGEGVDVRGVDLERPEGLVAALEGASHAYFLVHLMGQGPDFAEREHRAARDFAEAAVEAGVERVSYLGGLGGSSPHLRSRARTAEVLANHGPPLTYFRAAMVVGPGSESYVLLRAIVDKLPLAPAPPWLDNRTQPIGIRDLVAYLRHSPEVPEAAGVEVQIGVPAPLTHREVIDELARQLGVRGPIWLPISGRIASAGVMAAGAAAVTPGDREVASELAYGLGEETIITDPGGAEPFGIDPESIAVVLQRCIEQEERAEDG
ncbi:MAG: NAD(P)H-binding protein [Solirubrobacterales bacterium]